MVRKPKSYPKEDEEELSLKDVLALGGTEEDFESLKDIRDGTISETTKKKKKDSFKIDEFKEFFKSVGFDKIRDTLDDVSDEELSDDSYQEDDKSAEVSSPTQKPSTEKPIDEKVKKMTVKGEKKAKAIKDMEVNEKNQQEKEPEKKCDRPPLQVSLVTSTTNETPQATTLNLPPSKPLPGIYHHVIELVKIMPKKVIIKPSGLWYANEIFKLPIEKEESYKPNDPIVVSLKELGKKLMECEANLLRNHKNQDLGGNTEWMKTVSTAGTLSDKVAAYTLMIQKAPIHNYRYLDLFLGMLKKKGKREALIALEALRDLFLAELLPDNRHLRLFHQQPIKVLKKIFQQDHGGAMSKRLEMQKHLIQWTYEEQVKNTYKIIVDTIKNFFLQDTIESMKLKGLKVASDLLKSKPEQERELLTMLVNKLGDPKYKIASKALHTLHCVIHEHPMMQGIVVAAVRDLLLRPNIKAKCQYYCICFLSAQIFSNDRKEVADSLIQIYLAFFKAAVKQKNIDNKLLGAILTGVNRAYPFANSDDEKIMEELNILYRTVHVSSFGTTVQAMMLLFQVLSSRNELNDRYYNALYSTLLHPEMSICTNRHPMYLNLLFRSLKADPSDARVKAFLKRLLQTCSLQHPSYTSAVLVLLTELMRMRPNLKYFLGGDKLANSSLGQVVEDDSDEEHFVDVDEDSTKQEVGERKNPVANKPERSWTHLHNKSDLCRSTAYDPLHRTPAFANAESSSLWELSQIQKHYHPAVAKFVSQLVAVQKSSFPDRYSGDPLHDFTLMRFLDKFVYRNPKARQEKQDNANIGEYVFRRKRKIHMSDLNEVAANTPEFLTKKSYDPEDLFLHKYFASKAGSMPPTKKSKKEDIDSCDIEEVSDDEFDKFLDSTEGKVELETEYNFAEGTLTGSKKKPTKVAAPDFNVDENDEDEDVDYDDVDFDEPDDDIDDKDPFSEEGMAFADVDDAGDDYPTTTKIKSKKQTAKSKAGFEAIDMMLEENSRQKYGASGSGAVRNMDGSNAKQLQWERKKEAKEIVARKRSAKRHSSGFSKSGKQRKSMGKGKKNSFTKKIKSRKGRF